MKLNVIGHKKLSFMASGLLFFLAVLAIAIYGFKPGMDFTGGSSMNVSFSGAIPVISDVREKVRSIGYENAMVQTVGEDALLIKTKFLNESEHEQLLSDIRTNFETDGNKIFEQSFETIGPAISAQLRSRSATAIVVVNLAIIAFIAYAFRKVSRPVESWKYGLVAVISLIHDVTITAAVFAVLGRFMRVEVDVPFIVALLTVLGYSVNDTIVVFDRVRENLIRHSSDNFGGTVNNAINETLARSMNTTLTTLLALFALFLFGGITVKFFALALLVGIFLGAYSSIFVASPLLVVLYDWKNRNRE